MAEVCPLTGWPMGRTKCKCCGGDIIYLLYNDVDQKVRRRIPDFHNGHCAEVKVSKVIRKRREVDDALAAIKEEMI